ncbi:hypothetical protein [uncultured Porphyromonas sp.]|uniref:hypothetical protein n=1 Tax=uncultured Porphyromonas sp. TaxID=159274 RepID=UPI0026237812|nr:hypothetical protein [uncultured Porphyromonas sp.]
MLQVTKLTAVPHRLRRQSMPPYEVRLTAICGLQSLYDRDLIAEEIPSQSIGRHLRTRLHQPPTQEGLPQGLSAQLALSSVGRYRADLHRPASL